jgi:hypothetical protein
MKGAFTRSSVKRDFCDYFLEICYYDIKSTLPLVIVTEMQSIKLQSQVYMLLQFYQCYYNL